jgi:hypothetical protein
VTHVQVITKVWVDGELRASTSSCIDGLIITADAIAATARPAAFRAADFISSIEPATEPGQGKGQSNAVQ